MPSSPRWMDRRRTPRRSAGRRRFRPALESLDGRDLPAVSLLTPIAGVQALPGIAYTGALATFQDANITSPAALSHLHAAIDWGDGHISAGTVSGPDAGGNLTVSGTNTFPAAQLFPVTVSVRDDLDGSTASTFTLVSANGTGTVGYGTIFPGAGNPSASLDGTLQVNPVVVNAVAGQGFSGVVGVVYDRSANPSAGNLVALIDWGDGTRIDVQQVVAVAPGVFDVVGSHFYPVAGSGTVRMQVQDLSNGRMASAAAPLYVTDPGQAPSQTFTAPAVTSSPPTAGAPQRATSRRFPSFEDFTKFFGYWWHRRGYPHQRVWHPIRVYRSWVSYFRA
jgi:hypothetical protein